MDKLNVFARIHEMETQMGQLHSDLGELKLAVKELLEENQRLTIENEQVRKMLKRETSEKKRRQTSRSFLLRSSLRMKGKRVRSWVKATTI